MTEWKSRYFTCTKLLKVIDWDTKAVSTLQSGKHKELYDPFPSFPLLDFQLLCLFIAGAENIHALLRQRIHTCGVSFVLQWHLKPKLKVFLKGTFPHKGIQSGEHKSLITWDRLIAAVLLTSHTIHLCKPEVDLQRTISATCCCKGISNVFIIIYKEVFFFQIDKY